MTMYSGSSECYWKQRAKPNPLKSPRTIAFLAFVIISLSGIKLRLNSHERFEEQQRVLVAESMIRPTPNEENYRLCESNMRDALRIECDQLCSGETMSIPRSTMYRSCHHGCSRSFYSAAVVGCRQGTEEDAFTKMNSEANSSCSRYMNIEPRPAVQSTCKKYYREGTKRGRQMGIEFIDGIIDTEWAKRQDNKLTTHML